MIKKSESRIKKKPNIGPFDGLGEPHAFLPLVYYNGWRNGADRRGKIKLKKADDFLLFCYLQFENLRSW